MLFAAPLLLSIALIAPGTASATVLIHDSFEGSDVSVGDGSSINGGFTGFQSNQFPNNSTAIEANGSVQLIGDTFTRDAGYGLISNTGFDINQQITIDWNISSAFLENQADADHKDLDKIVLGVTSGQNFGNLFGGLEISLENGGQELRIQLHDHFSTALPDVYVSGLASGWDGQSAVSVQAIIDPLGYTIAVSTMQGIVTGLWNDQVRALTYLQTLTNQSTNLSYVFMNHFGSDATQTGPLHFTSIDSVTVSDSLVALPGPGAIGLFLMGAMMMGAGYTRRSLT